MCFSFFSLLHPSRFPEDITEVVLVSFRCYGIKLYLSTDCLIVLVSFRCYLDVNIPLMNWIACFSFFSLLHFKIFSPCEFRIVLASFRCYEYKLIAEDHRQSFSFFSLLLTVSFCHEPLFNVLVSFRCYPLLLLCRL